MSKKKLTKHEVITSIFNAICHVAYVGIYSANSNFAQGGLYNGKNFFFITFLGKPEVKFLGEAKKPLFDWDEKGFPKERKIYHFDYKGALTELVIEAKYTENI